MARRTNRAKNVTSAATPDSLRQRFRRPSPGTGPLVLPDVPPVASPAQSAGVATGPGQRHEPSPALLLVDARAALALANEARHRTLEGVFGIDRADANLLTAILALTLANSAYERVHRPKPPKPPTAVADLAIGLGILRESIIGVAGPASRDTPLGGTLVGLAILVGLARPPVVRSVREVRASSRRLYHGFRGRYGHLIPRRSDSHPAQTS